MSGNRFFYFSEYYKCNYGVQEIGYDLRPDESVKLPECFHDEKYGDDEDQMADDCQEKRNLTLIDRIHKVYNMIAYQHERHGKAPAF